MRLATIIPENGATALAAVSVDIDRFVGLHSFLSFFGSKELPGNPATPLEQFLSILMPPVMRPSTFRDFYAFEQHVRAARSPARSRDGGGVV